MHVSMEESGGLNALLKIKVEEADYQEKVEQALREQRRSLALPGFRPGKVPQGMVNKMIGKSVLTKTVINLAYDALTSYLSETKLRILGQPLARADEESALDWDTQKEFSFSFDLGLAPEIDIQLEDLSPRPYYTIHVDDKAVTDYVKEIQLKLGSYVEADTITGDTDLISFTFKELDENGQEYPDKKPLVSKFTLRHIKNEESKALLMGMSVGETTVINPEKAVGDPDKVANFIGAQKDDDCNYSADYKVTIDQVEALVPMTLGDELFANIFPGEEFASELEFLDAVRDRLNKMYDSEVQKYFYYQCRTFLLEDIEVPLPEAFLNRWVKENQQDGAPQLDMEAEMISFNRTMRWHLLEDALLEKYASPVSREDVHAYFIEDMRSRLGLTAENMSEEIEHRLHEMADKFIEEGKYVEEVESELAKQRLSHVFKQHIPLVEEEISVDQFIEILNKSNPIE